MSAVAGLRGAAKIVLVVVVAVAAHLVVRAIRWGGERILAPSGSEDQRRERLQRTNPKFTTLTILITSALTFAIYFTALGLVLSEASGGRIRLGAYLASASIVGLAVAFGSQGLVQDVVLGLTLVFSDTCDVGDVVEIGGQIGRVDRIGLRFTTIENHLGEAIAVPNRNIGAVGRYRGGCVRLLVDVQLPPGVDEAGMTEELQRIAAGIRAQYPRLVLREPKAPAVHDAGSGGWRFARLRLHVWPGQGPVVESATKPRIVSALRTREAGYQDWMVGTSYEAT